ncbi:MAG TPA: hypothetical protein DD667_15820 [Gammaproteobacteria bacterium]|nr:hypothetical protein [Gammaproteobacteria bacterium]
MNPLYIVPSTLRGISRLAKKIVRERGIKHTIALDVAAQISGYQNFKHARRRLASQAEPIVLQPLYLTVYWHDRDGDPFSGRCTAEVELPPDTISALPSLKDRGYWMFGGFELESEDHLRGRLDATSQERAMKRITDAVRQLQFCVATGLRSMRKKADKRRVEFLHELPGRDHISLWIDGATGGWLALDEPYPPRYSEKESKRKKWIEQHGLTETAPDWGGLYLPGSSVPFFLSADSDLLQRVTGIVEQMASVPSIDWDTHSGDYSSHFHSPARVASGKPYRGRPQPSFGQRAGAIPYGGRPGEASDWRPAEPMSIKQHQALGIILRGLAWSDLSVPVLEKLSSAISRLDDWSFLEHPDGTGLDDLYYGDKRATYAAFEDVLKGVAKARALIVAGYDECRPRRDLLIVLETVERDAQARSGRQVAKA